MALTLYCDESGYTGNDLLHEDQQHFAFASVAIEETEAEEFIRSVRTQHRIQPGLIELKGSNLLRTRSGQLRVSYGPDVVDAVFSSFADRIKGCISEKRYAFAAKVFDHLIEPGILENAQFLHSIDFHEFGAHLLYARFLERTDMRDFFKRVLSGRALEKSELEAFITNSGSPHISALLRLFEANFDTIVSDLAALRLDPVGKWKLELSYTNVITLLRRWNETGSSLDLVADDSGPLVEQQAAFRSLVASTTFCSSSVSAGIQIADIAAAGLIHAWTKDDQWAQRWRAHLPRIAAQGSVIADFQEPFIAAGSLECDRNLIVLEQLHRQSTGAEAVGAGMPELVMRATERLRR